MSRKRILFISSWYPTRINPTNGDFVQRHAQAVALLHEVVLLHVFFDRNADKKRELTTCTDNGFQEYILYFNTAKCFRFLVPLLYIFYYLKFYREISKKHGKFDILHANVLHPIGVVALLYRLFFNIPYIVTEHWTGFLPSTKVKLSWFSMFLIRRSAKKASAITPVSFNLQHSMQSIGIEGNYVVVNNVVNTDIFVPKEKNIQAQIHILHVSSLKDEHKNVSGILRAIQKVANVYPNIILDIVSENLIDKYLSLIDELGIKQNISFLGYKNRAEVADLMRNSSFLLLFSNYENFPCVIVESLAIGTPVLSSNVGGIAEHLTPDMGVLIEKGDEVALEEMIIWMCNNYQQFDIYQLSEYAQRNFCNLSVAQSFDGIYNKL